MTIWEIINSAQLKLEETSPNFKTTDRPDVDTLLSYVNMAQEKYFYDKYLNKGSVKETAEFIKRLASDELINLVQTSGVVTASSTTYYGMQHTYLYNTTFSQYAHFIDAFLLFSRSNPISSTEQWTRCDIADTIDTSNIETNSYNKPILMNPIVFLDGSASLNTASAIYTYIVTDAYCTVASSNNFNMRYLRKPKPLGFTVVSGSQVTTPELAVHTHEDILQLTVDLFLGDKFKLTTKQ